jgi:hypothetical protein
VYLTWTIMLGSGPQPGHPPTRGCRA